MHTENVKCNLKFNNFIDRFLLPSIRIKSSFSSPLEYLNPRLILHQVILFFCFYSQTKMSFEAASTWRDLCRIIAEESPLRSSSSRGCVHRRDQVSEEGKNFLSMIQRCCFMQLRVVSVYRFYYTFIPS